MNETESTPDASQVARWLNLMNNEWSQYLGCLNMLD